MIKQGVRRRHPKRVLNQYDGVHGTTNNAESVWEKALIDEQDRQQLDKAYTQHGEHELLSTQMGLVSTAHKNYSKSRFKLEAMHAIGV